MLTGIPTKLRTMATTLRNEGLRSFGEKAASALGYRSLHLLERRLDPVPEVTPPAGCRIGPLATNAFGGYLALRPSASREQVERRLACGSVCFGAWIGGELVSAFWMGTRGWSPPYLGGDPHLAPGEVAFFDAFTALACRRRSFCHAVSAVMMAVAKANGFETAIVLVVPWNHGSLRAHAKAGFRPRCTLRVIGLGPWRLRSYLPPAPEAFGELAP